MRSQPVPQAQLSAPEVAVLRTLVFACILIEAVLQLSDLGAFGRPLLRAWAYDNGAFWPGLLQGWRANYPAQPWLMFVTHGFLHGGLLHLGFNMVTLWSLGGAVTERVGLARFLWIYLGTMVLGAATYGVLATSGQPMVGASGALFGLAGALVAWMWLSQPTSIRSLRVTWRILAFLLGINLVMFVAFSGQIAWQTHLGGFVAGWILGIVFAGREQA